MYVWITAPSEMAPHKVNNVSCQSKMGCENGVGFDMHYCQFHNLNLNLKIIVHFW